MPRKRDGDYSNRQVKKTPFNAAAKARAAGFKATFLTVLESAKYVGLAPATMRKYCQCQCFRNAFIVGDEYLIPVEDLDWWKDNRKGRVGRPPKSES